MNHREFAELVVDLMHQKPDRFKYLCNTIDAIKHKDPDVGDNLRRAVQNSLDGAWDLETRLSAYGFTREHLFEIRIRLLRSLAAALDMNDHTPRRFFLQRAVDEIR